MDNLYGKGANRRNGKGVCTRAQHLALSSLRQASRVCVSAIRANERLESAPAAMKAVGIDVVIDTIDIAKRKLDSLPPSCAVPKTTEVAFKINDVEM